MNVGDSTRIPATAAQAGMWFAQRMVPGSSAFVIAHAWDVRGHVDLTVLRQALTGAIRDADGLGTRFAPDDEDGVTAEPAAWDVADVRVVDLSHEADPEAAADSRIRGHARTPIDPASEPCFGAEILVLGPDRTSIALWAHHIVLDVFGFGLLARRVAALYRAGGTDQSSRRPVSAAALVDEETAYRASDARSEDIDFWADELRGVAAPEWPTVPEGHHVAREVRTTVVRLDRATTTALHDFAAADGRSWGEAFTALLGTFVSSRTAESEVVLGFPMMNRFGSVAATVPAMAVNVAPLRLRVGPHATARTALAETGAAVSRIRSHTRMRGEELSRGTGGVRPRVWANIKPFSDTLRLGDATATIRSISRGPVPGLSVTAQIVGSDDGVHGELELCVDGDAASFDDSALGQCAADLCAHVSASLAHPDTGAAHLPAASPAEGAVRHGAPETHWETVSDMFFDVVARRGTDVAVTSGPEQLTYTELGARVARVARWLAGRGVGTEDRVAVSMPRGVDAVVSLLGVLASGAGVVPMDPSHPRERRERMLADSAPALVLTTESIDDAAPELARLPHGPVTDSDRVRGVWGGSVGCVLFTSGSTGVPKGVVGSQAGLANRVSWAVDRWSVPAGVADVRVSKSAVTFVDGVTELLAGLCSGARVVLASDDVAVDPVALRGLMVRESVTQVTGVPSMLSAVFDGDAGELGALRLFRVVSSGERLDPAVAEVIRAAVPGVELVDSYGSSEIAGDVLGADGAALTTGMTYVVPGTRVHVLDAWLRPVVPGVVGELYVSG
ncbi:AMP-binding protein, partial [Rhodococcus sp. HNM0569]|uniref:AMP-binding protein n=1 Tax=Rhodococcus sp. HNM0569 TaxID=2716340 RepID=UPI00146ED4B2|nr:AMP-binding protein [Rhodococcus sp. HNM0569]